MRYRALYRVLQDGRAPGVIKLSQYEELASVEAATLSRAMVEMRKGTEDPTSKARPLKIGDVLVDEQDQYWIFTPSFQWAKVQAVD